MIDYHTHLWPHSERQSGKIATIDTIASYCDKALASGVEEIALTEHLFRFSCARPLIAPAIAAEPEAALAVSMQDYFDFHALGELDEYVECVVAAKADGLPVVLGLEVDLYPGEMDKVACLLDGYPFDVLLGSVHWLGTWRFDDLSDRTSMDFWERIPVETAWSRYSEALAEMSGSGVCDVVAHPDLIKVTGRIPPAPEELWDAMAEVMVASGMAAELSSAGCRKPVGEDYPGKGLLGRLVEMGASFTMASDAHGVDLVADRAGELSAILAAAGIEGLRGFRGRQPVDLPL